MSRPPQVAAPDALTPCQLAPPDLFTSLELADHTEARHGFCERCKATAWCRQVARVTKATGTFGGDLYRGGKAILTHREDSR